MRERHMLWFGLASWLLACSPSLAPSSSPPRGEAPTAPRAQGSPSAHAMPAEPAATRASLELAWVADWHGAQPELFAFRDAAVLTVLGPSELAGSLVTDGAPGRKDAFWIVELGRDRGVRRRAALSFAVRAARGLHLLHEGDLFVDFVRADAQEHELARVRADGSLAWAVPLGADATLSAFAVDETTGRIAVAVRRSGVPAFGPRGTRWSLDVRVYSSTGALSTSLTLSSAKTPEVRALALAADDLAIAGMFHAPLHIAASDKRIAILPGARAPFFVASVEHGTALKWAVTPGSSAALEPSEAHFRSDGSLFVGGHGIGPDAVRAALAPTMSRSAGAVAGGAAHPVNFALTLEPRTGAALALDVNPGVPRTTSERSAERVRLPKSSGSIDGVAMASDGSVFVQGAYPAILSFAGFRLAALAGTSASARYLAFFGVQGVSAPPAGERATRRPGLYDRTTAGPSGPSGPRFSELTAKGHDALGRKHYEKACALFASAQAKEPEDTANLLNLGRCLQKAGDSTAAVAVYRHLLDLVPLRGMPRRDIYASLDELGARKAFAFQREPCATLESDSPTCEEPVFVCGLTGTYGPSVHHITSYAFARFALDETGARIAQHSGLEWPELGRRPDTTTEVARGATVDVTVAQSVESKASDDGTSSTESTECGVVHADGCSRRVALACTWRPDADSKAPTRYVLELTLRAP